MTRIEEIKARGTARAGARWEDIDWLLERNAELLKAIRGLVYLTDQGREGGLILSRADRKPITNGDQYVIDSAYIAAEGAITAMEKTS